METTATSAQDRPAVSVIVPVYNAEKTLRRCLDSLLAQRFSDLELLVVDDGSTDSSAAICKEYASADPRVRLCRKENGGVSSARNLGLKEARGEFIAFCDSDDYVDTDMYETMYNTAVENHADVVFTGIQTVDQNGIISPMNDYPTLQIIKEKNRIHHFAMDMIASEPSDPTERHVAMSAKIALYRKALIDRYNLQFVSERIIISEDLIWNLDILCHATCIVTLPQTFYYYYKNLSSLSKQIRTDRFAFFKALRKELCQRTKFYGMPQETKLRIDRMFIGYCRFYIGNIYNSSLLPQNKKKIISEICKDKIWSELWHTYPISKMSKIHFLMLLLIKHNCYNAMSLIYKIKK